MIRLNSRLWSLHHLSFSNSERIGDIKGWAKRVQQICVVQLRAVSRAQVWSSASQFSGLLSFSLQDTRRGVHSSSTCYAGGWPAGAVRPLSKVTCILPGWTPPASFTWPGVPASRVPVLTALPQTGTEHTNYMSPSLWVRRSYSKIPQNVCRLAFRTGFVNCVNFTQIVTH